MQTTATKIISLTTAAALLLGAFVFSTSVSAKGPHNKATGSVTWTARTNQPVHKQIPGIVSEFNAHDMGPGMNDKGSMSITIPENNVTGDGTRVFDIACVHVTDGEAWFAGAVVEADGDFAGSEGDVNLFWVLDGSTSGAEADKIGGMPYGSLTAACAAVENEAWTGSGDVTAGNLMVHYKD